MREIFGSVAEMAGAGRRGRRVRVGAAVAVTAVGLFGAAAVAGPGAAGEPFTVSPGEGEPFQVIDVSGANCSEGSQPTVFGLVVGSPEVGVVTEFAAAVDENGDWAATFTVPPNKPVGQYVVTATCKTDPSAPTGVDYQDQPFTILTGEVGTMTVSPRTAQAGQDVVVTVAGTQCRGLGTSVDIGAFLRQPEELGDADEFVARATAVPDPDGNWTTELTIPASTSPGTYGVGAQCIDEGFQVFVYQTVDVVLSAPHTGQPSPAPPAVPVTGRPNFTG
jgi:hypothetical protein